MWRTDDGVVHVNRIASPGSYIESSLRRRLDQLADEEKVALYYEIGAQVTELTDQLFSAPFDPLIERSFETAWLPDEYQLVDDDGAAFSVLVSNQALTTPERWRLELVSLVPDYLLDTGPKWRKWKRIMKKIDVIS
jgi:hypothetical protein